MTPPLLATRCMKARWPGRMHCGCYIRTGTRIVLGTDGRWRCITCVLATITRKEPAA